LRRLGSIRALLDRFLARGLPDNLPRQRTEFAIGQQISNRPARRTVQRGG